MAEYHGPKTWPYTPTGDESVKMETHILDTEIHYSVVVGNQFVWHQTAEFGKKDAHRAASEAFKGIAQEQEKVAHAWADKINAAGK